MSYEGDDQRKEFRERMFADLERIEAKVSAIDTKFDTLKDEEIAKMKLDIGMLKVKSGIWGLIGGALGVFLILLGKKIGM